MAKVTLDFPTISSRMQSLMLPPDIDLVVGIGSGGIVPSALIAHQLGCDLRIMWLNFRDPENRPIYEQPQLLEVFDLGDEINRHILLVDDVSVTGKTLDEARDRLRGNRITTLVCKGKADIVLFPEITSCVLWPWKR